MTDAGEKLASSRVRELQQLMIETQRPFMTPQGIILHTVHHAEGDGVDTCLACKLESPEPSEETTPQAERLGTCERTPGILHEKNMHGTHSNYCVNWQPVASPQATRPHDDCDCPCEKCADGGEHCGKKPCDCAAQPAAGTTPQAERCLCHRVSWPPNSDCPKHGARAVAPAETPDEQDCTCANVNTDMPCSVHTVETRLTAEQFHKTYRNPKWDDKVCTITNQDYLFELMEAFRDKSEVELLETQQSLTNALLESKQKALRLREEMAISNIKLGVAHKALLNEINTRNGLREEIERLRGGKQ